MQGKILGVNTSTFKDGTISGRLYVQLNNERLDNANGVCVQPVNISLDNLPVKNISELVGKNVFISDSGYPKYTWANDILVL